MRDEVNALLQECDYDYELHDLPEGSLMVRDNEWQACVPGSPTEGRVMRRHSIRECHVFNSGWYCYVGNAEDDDWADLIVTGPRAKNEYGYYI